MGTLDRYEFTPEGALKFISAIRFRGGPQVEQEFLGVVDQLTPAHAVNSNLAARAILRSGASVVSSDIGPDVEIGRKVLIHQSSIQPGDIAGVYTTIGEETQIDASTVHGSTIGRENKIRDKSMVRNTETEDGVELDNTQVVPDTDNEAAKVQIGSGTHMYGSFVGSGVEIGKSATIKNNTNIAPGAYVGHSAELNKAIILNSAYINPDAKITDSTIGHDTAVGERAEITRAEIGPDNRIAEEVVITGPSPEDATVLQRKVTTRQAVVLGRNAILTGATFIGEASYIGANTTLHASRTSSGVEIGDNNNFTHSDFESKVSVGAGDSLSSARPKHLRVSPSTRIGDFVKWFHDGEISVGSNVEIGDSSAVHVSRVENGVIVVKDAALTDPTHTPYTVVIPRANARLGKSTHLPYKKQR